MDGLPEREIGTIFDKLNLNIIIVEQKDARDINSLTICFANQLSELNRGSKPEVPRLNDTIGLPLVQIFPDVLGSELLSLISNSVIQQLELTKIINHESEYVGKLKYSIQIFPLGNSRSLLNIRNIEKEEEIKNRLKLSQKRYRRLVEDAPVGIVGQRNGKIAFSNPTHLKMFGYSDEKEILGRKVREFFRDDLGKMIQDRAENREKGNIEPESYISIAKRKDGSLFDIQMDISQVELDDGPMNIAFERDISQTRQLEEELMFRQRMDSIGTLASGIVHDFNNVLTTIQLNTDYILHIDNIDGDIINSTKHILIAIDRAREIIKQIQYVSSSRLAEKEEEVNLLEIIQEVFGFLKNKISKKIEFSVDIDPDITFIGSKAHFNQIFMNLGTNSLTAIQQSSNRVGMISVSTENIIKDNIEYCRIYFRDNGSGIPKSNRSRIFDPFYSTKSNLNDQFSRGLGLAMVYNIITRYYKGEVQLGDLTSWTEFIIELPYSTTEVRSSAKEVARPKSLKRRILIIDDDEGIRFSLSKGLERLGYDFYLAKNGTEGLKLLEKHSEKIDLVVLDMIMPGLSGSHVLKLIEESEFKQPIIIISGFIEQIPNKGKYEFLEKPFSINDLDEKINELVHEMETPITQ